MLRRSADGARAPRWTAVSPRISTPDSGTESLRKIGVSEKITFVGNIRFAEVFTVSETSVSRKTPRIEGGVMNSSRLRGALTPFALSVGLCVGSAGSASDGDGFRIGEAEWKDGGQRLAVKGEGRHGRTVSLTNAAG